LRCEINRSFSDTCRRFFALKYPALAHFQLLFLRYNTSTPKSQLPALQSTSPLLIDICSAFALASYSIIANCLRNNIYRSQFTPAISTVKMPGYTQELDAVSNAAMNGSVQGFALHLLSLDEYSLTDLPQIRRHIPSHRCHRSSFSPIIALGRLQSRATSFLHARGDRRHIAKGDAATDQRFRCSVRCCGE